MEDESDTTICTLGHWFIRITVILGLAASAYSIYDLLYPNHFVGDMYGLEVFVRMLPLAISGAVFVLALLFIVLSQKSTRARLAGMTLITIADLCLVLIAMSTAHSRYEWRQRERYPRRPVEELLQLAIEEQDIFAMDAIGTQRDPAAVPRLAYVLLDKDENIMLREGAARALGFIGTAEAGHALEEALADSPPQRIRTAIEYAMQDYTRRRQFLDRFQDTTSRQSDANMTSNTSSE